jgi:beta-glucanase (GH16 family)
MGAFWLSGTTGLSPQLDIAEMVANSPNTVVNTVWNSADATSGWANVADMTQGYHTYAVDWEPDFITWYFDGQQTFQVPTPSNLHSPLFLVAGLTSGQPGSWEGVADSSSSSQMKIDYIRAYDANPYTSGGALTFQSSDNGGNSGSTGTTTSGTDTSSSSSADATANTSSPTDSSGAQQTGSDGSTTDTATASINSVTVNSGSDTLSATSSPDVFLFDGSGHRTSISDFDPSVDKLDFEMTSQDFSDVSITTGRNGFARIDFDGNRINLPGVTADQLTQNNFVFNSSGQ